MGGCCSRDDYVGKMPRRRGMEMEEEEHAFYETGEGGSRVRLWGSCMAASMFSQQGWKGVNQDAMTVWEDFGGDKDSVFCGTFDGHGPYGHRVARYVRDALPSKLQFQATASLLSKVEEAQECEFDSGGDHSVNDGLSSDDADRQWISSWKSSLVAAFEELDAELSAHPKIDCICSGATAVAVLNQSEHLIIANLGDSRAVLCTRDDQGQLAPVQLTVDQKPNLPGEAERIKSCKGRVFSLEEEPDVHRIWLPDEDCPGLAMARAFGDFCLKDFGLISTPQVSYRKLSDRDEFVVLATDGVWDVLSNKEVIKIISSSTKRSEAAKQVVDRAVKAWRLKHPTSKVDDCTVICLYLKHPSKVIGWTRTDSAVSSDASRTDSFTTAISEVSEAEAEVQKEWTALQGVCRVNSIVKLHRLSKALSWGKKSF